jgi:hypothetical protein
VEDILFANNDLSSAPVVMAIKLASTSVAPGSTSKARSTNVGIAYADTSVRELGVADFVDNDLFSNIEVIFFSLDLSTVTERPYRRLLSNFLSKKLLSQQELLLENLTAILI